MGFKQRWGGSGFHLTARSFRPLIRPLGQLSAAQIDEGKSFSNRTSFFCFSWLQASWPWTTVCCLFVWVLLMDASLMHSWMWLRCEFKKRFVSLFLGKKSSLRFVLGRDKWAPCFSTSSALDNRPENNYEPWTLSDSGSSGKGFSWWTSPEITRSVATVEWKLTTLWTNGSQRNEALSHGSDKVFPEWPYTETFEQLCLDDYHYLWHCAWVLHSAKLISHTFLYVVSFLNV